MLIFEYFSTSRNCNHTFQFFNQNFSKSTLCMMFYFLESPNATTPKRRYFSSPTKQSPTNNTPNTPKQYSSHDLGKPLIFLFWFSREHAYQSQFENRMILLVQDSVVSHQLCIVVLSSDSENMDLWVSKMSVYFGWWSIFHISKF